MTEGKIKFGKIFWPSFLAVVIGGIISTVIYILSLFSVLTLFFDMGESELEVKDNTVLHMKLEGEIAEQSSSDLSISTFSFKQKKGLPDILHGLKKAQNDDRIKGLFLELGDVNCGVSTAKEIRKAIDEFEKSGKFVVAYLSGEYVSQKTYYISSVANEVYGFPSTVFQWTGLGGEVMFYTGLLEKLDVEVEVIRGKNNDFKSAVEPFFRKEMSDSSRLQTKTYMNSIWSDICQDISKDKSISVEKLNIYADSLSLRKMQDAVKFKFINGVKYRDEVMQVLAKKVGVDNPSSLNLLAVEKYGKYFFFEDQEIRQIEKPKIAVIVAEGDISRDGDGIASEKLCKLWKKVREEVNIEAVVFRINSPGGSALASDEIWREVELTKAKKKVIVSMGDVAASGGYYIAAPAHRIFAENSTITGSIGVFGMIPYTGKMLENKLGITFDRVSTNKHASLSLNRKLTKEELSITQAEVDEIYDDFLSKVATGRKMTKENVNKVARGRVWAGSDAVKIGLVDEIGGLTAAIAYAAKLVNGDKDEVLYYPSVEKDFADKFIDFLEDENEKEEDEKDVTSTNQLPEELLEYYKELKKIESMSGLQMRLPFNIRFY
ncbi:MAG: signal peptide peptidase SppA [Bacteroidetes bacterium]|nr:signal peptide peptidase SppA [Bacteroidota bacterium]